jgi:hypothetical protein
MICHPSEFAPRKVIGDKAFPHELGSIARQAHAAAGISSPWGGHWMPRIPFAFGMLKLNHS